MTKYRLFLLSEIKNAAEIYDQILRAPKDQLDYIFVNAALILDPFHIDIAVNKALQDSSKKTRSVKTEIIYNLSHSSSIIESLKLYGFNSSMTEAILITFTDIPSFLDCKTEPLTLDNLMKYNNVEAIKRVIYFVICRIFRYQLAITVKHYKIRLLLKIFNKFSIFCL